MTGITTDEAVATGPTTARVKGTIGDLSKADHDEYGFCYSLGENPDVDSIKVIRGNDPGRGAFADTLIGLRGSTTYYVRAFVMEDDEYIYGDVKSFTTSQPQAPQVVTTSPTNVTPNSAISGGIVTYDGGAAITARGVCWDTVVNPTLLDSHTVDSSSTGSFNSSINNLLPNVKYYVRAYAVNSVDTVYGAEFNFTTGITWPAVTTSPVTDVTYNSAVSGGEITSDGGSPVTARGVCWRTSPNPTVANDTTNNGTGTGAFVSPIRNLSPNTKYYVRAYAVNAYWTVYGSESSFTTPVTTPSVRIDSVRYVSSTSATVHCAAPSDGGSAITARGVCWSIASDPTTANDHTSDGNSTGSFISSITGLTPNTSYYVRAYATSSIGTTYSSQTTFTTNSTVTDVDGNIYNTVTIGAQTWMVENLKTTKYRNNTSIANVTDNTAWSNLTSSAYCNYDNNSSNADIYGRLYNWYAVNDERKIAPTGWRVACDEDWKALEMYLGMTQQQADAIGWRGTDQGNKLKEAGNTHWASPSAGTNSSGFTALPGGYRYIDGSYCYISFLEYWWSSTEYDTLNAWLRGIGYGGGDMDRNNTNKRHGLSIRCIKGEAQLPTISTTSASAMTSTSAVSGGTITSDGGYPVTARGVCWSTISSPTLANDHTTDGSGTGSFISNLTGLTPFMTYYARAYATNSHGTAYGNNVTFATLPVASDSITDVDGNVYHTVTIGTQIWLVENLKTTKFRNGESVALVTDPSAWNNLTTGAYCNYNNNSANGNIYGKLYNWYAVNDSRNIAPTGWRVATDDDWTTLVNYLGGESIAGGKLKEAGYTHWYSPNTGATNESGFTALPGGYRLYDASFIYLGYIGNCWTSTESDTANAWHSYMHYGGTDVLKLDRDKNNGFSIRCVKGEAQLPTLSTTSVTSMTTTTAVSGGNITSDGGSTVTARGVCWNTTQNPTTANSKTINGSGTGSFISNLTGLSPNTTYYVRAYATNGSGTGYGNEVNLITVDSIVTDINGYVYHAVTIGNQVWLKENLRTTNYRNGEGIPNITDNSNWTLTSSPAYCNYDNSTSNGSHYGRLYNWYAVSDSRNIAPVGWHVASHNDWTTLTDYLGGESVAGGKLKEIGFEHWYDPNTGATNESGFTALPGGGRSHVDGTFSSLGLYGSWWTSSVEQTDYAWYRKISYNNILVSPASSSYKVGRSIRCVKD